MGRSVHAVRRTSANALPDALLPSQMAASARPDAVLQPERLLMLAVLEEAVGTYCKHYRRSTRRAARLFQEAETWCASDDTHWPYSFVNICQVLGIDVAYLRAGLVRWRRQALTAHRAE